MFDLRLVFVLYMMATLLLAYPLYFEEKRLNRPGFWFNMIVTCFGWPVFVVMFLYFLGKEFFSEKVEG